MADLFKVTGLDSFKHSLEAALARQQGTLNKAYRGFVVKVLSELVTNTPQWSGDLAASWRVRAEGVSSREGGEAGQSPFKSVPIVRPAPHFKGDTEALDYALMASQEAIASIRYNTRVTIFNSNPTGEIIIFPNVKLRPDNFIRGDVMAIAHTISKYGGGHIRLGG